ncbi:hypothetical protein BD410DRAFT_531911 [Rickenella mellea]|uniref:Uncharacterized protein n=1 Tax=Rickenella mellea TaxID=50990 RepID=A0A4Y7QGD0_9AGAM|nr:hypothetical protein BD410DRAFT_531911 [Rickenella mellea]
MICCKIGTKPFLLFMNGSVVLLLVRRSICRKKVMRPIWLSSAALRTTCDDARTQYSANNLCAPGKNSFPKGHHTHSRLTPTIQKYAGDFCQTNNVERYHRRRFARLPFAHPWLFCFGHFFLESTFILCWGRAL